MRLKGENSPFSLCLNLTMNNLLFSLTQLGEGIVNGLTGALGGLGYAILINLFGVIAICLKITETQNKKRNAIVLLCVLGNLCWITYFVLNGNFTSAALNFVGCIQGLVFLQRGKHKWAYSKFWLFFFICLQLFAGIITWNSWFSIFAIIGGPIGTIAYFVMNEKIYRYLFACSISLWIINGIVYFYWIALIHDVFALISVLIAIVRYNILGRDKKENKV